MKHRPKKIYWITAIAYPIAFLFILAALLRYTSWSNRAIFERWSEIHFTLISLFILLFFGALFRIWRNRFHQGAFSARELLIGFFAAYGVFVWSVSFFVSSIENSQAGGRFLDLVFFGSTLPAAILLEWASMIFLFVAMVIFLVAMAQRTLLKGTPKYRRAENGLTIFISISTLILLFEGGTRLWNILVPITQGFPTKSSALWTQRFVRLNSLGYRDREHRVRPREGVERILLIGDSYTFGSGIKDPADRLSKLLEEDLNQLSWKRRFEVINVGVGDTDTLDHVETLKRMLVFEPDHVLLVYVFNDIEHVTKPRRSVVTDRRSHWDRIHPLRLLVLNSHLAEQIYVRVRKGFYRYFGKLDRLPPDENPYQIESVLEAHLRTLDRFFQLCEDAHIKARLVPFDHTVALRESFVRRHDGFVESVSTRGISVWSIASAFKAYEYDDLIVNNLDGHPNELANRLASAVIAERFYTEF